MIKDASFHFPCGISDEIFNSQWLHGKPFGFGRIIRPHMVIDDLSPKKMDITLLSLILNSPRCIIIHRDIHLDNRILYIISYTCIHWIYTDSFRRVFGIWSDFATVYIGQDSRKEMPRLNHDRSGLKPDEFLLCDIFAGR